MKDLNENDASGFEYFDYCFLLQLVTNKQIELSKLGIYEAGFDGLNQLKEKLWQKMQQWSSE